jgi:hypothetical protein
MKNNNDNSSSEKPESDTSATVNYIPFSGNSNSVSREPDANIPSSTISSATTNPLATESILGKSKRESR